MKPKTIIFPAPNCLFFIAGPDLADTPDIDGQKSVWSTPSCIAVGCMPDCDGDTKVTIGTASGFCTDDRPVFDGQLETPNRSLRIELVPDTRAVQFSDL